MADNALNLALRFVLELMILYALAYWGWTQHDGPLRVVMAIGLPLIAALLWGVFRTPGDHGQGLVDVPGAIRLVLELALFAAGVLAFYYSERETWAALFGTVVLLHYLVSFDRVLRLLRAG